MKHFSGGFSASSMPSVGPNITKNILFMYNLHLLLKLIHTNLMLSQRKPEYNQKKKNQGINRKNQAYLVLGLNLGKKKTQLGKNKSFPPKISVISISENSEIHNTDLRKCMVSTPLSQIQRRIIYRI